MDGDTFPLTYGKIDKYKRKVDDLVDKLKYANYYTKSFCGRVVFTQLIFQGNKIVMPEILQKYAVKWYHTYLLHA